MTNSNKMPNRTYKPRQHLSESLSYKDLDGMMKSTIHVDEFSSKMGEDADIIVVSFFVRSKEAARDLVGWFEKGYDFVVDSDQSPGEIKPNRYLVYVEIRRRSAAPRNVQNLLDDLETLTEYSADDWSMHYEGKIYPWSQETFAKVVPLSPDAYRETHEAELNEWRDAAGIPAKKVYETKSDMIDLQSAAGIR